MLVDRKDAIAKGLAIIRNGHGCDSLYYSALHSVHGDYINERRNGGRQLAMIVADILIKDPKSSLAGTAYNKY